MSMFVKVAGTYRAGTLHFKSGQTYTERSAFVKLGSAYTSATGAPPPAFEPSLDFSDARNSQYLALVSVGGM